MELVAPARWQTIDFVSDLHLQAAQPQTSQAFAQYIQTTSADAVFILGDLFEVWVGDDVLGIADGFERQWGNQLQAASQRLSLYIMHGNRDFLMGTQFTSACGATLLPDPSVLSFADQRWLLSHGDEWCLADVDYLTFREQVRSPAWQTNFLQQPLDARIEMARAMRARSEAHKSQQTTYADVDSAKAVELLALARARRMIHGHTHRPDCHTMASDMERWILSDWDCAANPPRAQVLRVSRHGRERNSGFSIKRIAPDTAGNRESIISKSPD